MRTAFKLEKIIKKQCAQKTRSDYTSLQNTGVQQSFTQQFKLNMQSMSIPRNIDEQLLDFNFAIRNAAQDNIPKQVTRKNRPWISSMTLALIDERNVYRQMNDCVNEKRIGKLIKAQVRLDRQGWLNIILENRNWNAIKQ